MKRMRQRYTLQNILKYGILPNVFESMRPYVFFRQVPIAIFTVRSAKRAPGLEVDLAGIGHPNWVGGLIQRDIGSPAELQTPVVSVVVPAYNAEEYIGPTLQSLAVQTLSNIEIIVVDDGSTDRTARIVLSFVKADGRIKLIRQLRGGVALARNVGIKVCRGQFIAPVDADDISHPEKMERLLECISSSGENVGLVYSWSEGINHSGRFTGHFTDSHIEGDVFADLLCENFIGNASACMIRKDCLDIVGDYNTTYLKLKAQGCEDFDLYLRLAEQFKFRVVKEFLTSYRTTHRSMSNNYLAMARSYDFVLQDLKLRNQWIPDKALRWAYGSFSLWISSVAYGLGCYRDSIRYLLQSVRNDPSLLVSSHSVRILTRNIWHLCRMPPKSRLRSPKSPGLIPDGLKAGVGRERNPKTSLGPTIDLFLRERRREHMRRLVRNAREADQRARSIQVMNGQKGRF
jgi:glycosyltransferase involved in cell wall biosynthesis